MHDTKYAVSCARAEGIKRQFYYVNKHMSFQASAELG